jgi:quercetin dioxygenase-like cupin family protein
MITRREMNGSLAAALAAVFTGGAGVFVEAQAVLAQEGGTGNMVSMSSVAVKTLMQEPLAEIPNAEVTVITLTVAPGTVSPPHEHTGPVFAYLLEGEIENQVEPNSPQKYRAGEYFYEPPMHVHRSLRNLSSTEPAKLLIFQIGEKGKQFTVGAK